MIMVVGLPGWSALPGCLGCLGLLGWERITPLGLPLAERRIQTGRQTGDKNANSNSPGALAAGLATVREDVWRDTFDQLRPKISFRAATTRLGQDSDAGAYVIDERHTGGREVNVCRR
jgi:hypothetical protein